MDKFKQIVFLSFFVLAALALFTTPAFAQIDLVGEWAPQFHEDNPERLAGPDVGDFAGLPINDAARMMADSWNADILSVPEASMQATPRGLLAARAGRIADLEEVDPSSRQVIAIRTHIQWQAPERWIGWMAVRILTNSRSTRGKASRRENGSAGTESHDHSLEKGLDPPQRYSPKRSSGVDRILLAARRVPHVDGRH
jgi:hypothetical protein